MTDTTATATTVTPRRTAPLRLGLPEPLTAEQAAVLAERAVATARVSRPLTPVRIELADEPIYRDVRWISAYERNPFDVPEAERQGRMRELIDRLLAEG